MATLLPPRYYGTIFHVKYTLDEKKSSRSKPAILITGKDSFMVLKDDWKEAVAQISTNHVTATTKNPDGVLVQYKADGKQNYIYLESEKSDKLYSAITVETSKTAQMPSYATLTKIIPTFKFEMLSTTEELYDNLVNMQTRFYASFGCQKPAQMPFVDILTCLYRFRYGNDAADQIQNNVDSLLIEFRRQFFSDWCFSILKAATFDPKQKNAYDYSVRLVSNLLTDIHLNSDSIEANTTDLYKAVAEMCERGDATNITSAVKSMTDMFQGMFEDNYKHTKCLKEEFVQVLARVALLLFCGNMIQIYPIEVERLVMKTVDFTAAVYNGNSIQENFVSLVKTVESFHNEMLRFMDDKRYDPMFRFVFVSAELAEKIKSTQIKTSKSKKN